MIAIFHFQNERNSLLTSSVEVLMFWKDEYMVWNPDDYGGLNETRVLPEQIWTPDILLYNK